MPFGDNRQLSVFELPFWSTYFDLRVRINHVKQVVEAFPQVQAVAVSWALLEETAHGIFSRDALREIADLVEDVFKALHTVEFDKAVQRTRTKVVLEAWRRLRRDCALGPCEINHASLLAFGSEGTELDFEILRERLAMVLEIRGSSSVQTCALP